MKQFRLRVEDREFSYEGVDLYVCGVPETREVLAAPGVPDDSVFVEEWEGDAVSDGDDE